MASALYEAQRNSKSAVTAWLLHIHFDAFFETPAKDFYFSTTTDTEFFIDGATRQFKGMLSSVPQGRHQRERGNDYSQFVLSNPHNETYQDFLDYEDLIERGEVRIFQCFEIDGNYWEGEQRFYGFLKDFTVNESDKTLEFTALSDMSRPGFPVGARILTRERCGTDFNFNGANPPEYHACGWQLDQGGNPVFCSKLLKGADGCIAHGNAHRFYALPALSVAAVEFVPNSEIDFPYDTSSCFTEHNYICDENWHIYPIPHAKAGTVIMAPNLYSGFPEKATILEVQTHIVDAYSIANFTRGGALGVTNEHLFKIHGSTYAPIGTLHHKWVMGVGARKELAKERLESLMHVSKRTAVYNLRTTSNTYFITDQDALFYFDVHNQKARTPGDQ